mgnify:CR=1 FL=1
MRAIIDLGTNTFHLLIVNDKDEVLLKISNAAKIGMGGIQKGIITPEGIERALKVLKEFKEEITKFGIETNQIFAFGTSALRSASNKQEVLDVIKKEVDIEVQVISGEREAELIYDGVKQAVTISKPSLIIDIGGGSVEFIICNHGGILWKQSFEIGGQRLMDMFYKSDPISHNSIEKLTDYVREKLLPLANACHQYSPTTIVGSSGSFDTLNSMYYYEETGEGVPIDLIGNDYPIEAFYKAYEKLLTKNREERLALPGMVELRVDMIVVAVCLIKYILQTFNISKIKVSKFAMKEGILLLTKS